MKLINPASGSSIEIDNLPQLEVDKDAFIRGISARKTGDNNSIPKLSRRLTVKKLNDHQKKRLKEQ